VHRELLDLSAAMGGSCALQRLCGRTTRWCWP